MLRRFSLRPDVPTGLLGQSVRRQSWYPGPQGEWAPGYRQHWGRKPKQRGSGFPPKPRHRPQAAKSSSPGPEPTLGSIVNQLNVLTQNLNGLTEDMRSLKGLTEDMKNVKADIKSVGDKVDTLSEDMKNVKEDMKSVKGALVRTFPRKHTVITDLPRSSVWSVFAYGDTPSARRYFMVSNFHCLHLENDASTSSTAPASDSVPSTPFPSTPSTAPASNSVPSTTCDANGYASVYLPDSPTLKALSKSIKCAFLPISFASSNVYPWYDDVVVFEFDSSIREPPAFAFSELSPLTAVDPDVSLYQPFPAGSVDHLLQLELSAITDETRGWKGVGRTMPGDSGAAVYTADGDIFGILQSSDFDLSNLQHLADAKIPEHEKMEQYILNGQKNYVKVLRFTPDTGAFDDRTKWASLDVKVPTTVTKEKVKLAPNPWTGTVGKLPKKVIEVQLQVPSTWLNEGKWYHPTPGDTKPLRAPSTPVEVLVAN